MPRTLLDFFMAGVQGFYPVSIPYSCRFDSARSCYLARTPGGAGNAKTWTFSAWVKLCASSPSFILFMAGTTGANYDALQFSGGQLLYDCVTSSTSRGSFTSAAIFRDPGSHFHLLVKKDATAGTLAVYVNGVQISMTQNVALANVDGIINTAVQHNMSRNGVAPSTGFADAYLSEVYFIDGQALAPTSFGQFSSQNPNVWVPKTPTGLTYGTNGFHLDFSNAAALGTDTSGNGNTYTISGLASTDQMADTPTNNCCTWNPLYPGAATSNGNLAKTTNWSTSTFAMQTGKWAWKLTTVSTNNTTGLFTLEGNAPTVVSGAYYITLASGSTYEFFYDADSGLFQYKQNGGTLTTIGTVTSSIPYVFYNTANCVAQFASFTPSETGYKTLEAKNLPDPAIIDSTKGFDAKLWTGTGAAQNITSFNFQPDFVWLKDRSVGYHHAFSDSVRGPGYALYSDLAGAEAYSATAYLTALLSNGFSVGTNANFGANGSAMVAWAAKKGSAFGMDIVSYTGNNTAGRTVAHSLGAVPEMIIVKSRSSSSNWPVYHKNANATPQNYYLHLNETIAATSSIYPWNNTAPTASVFSLGEGSSVNLLNDNYIAYLFRSISGFSFFGSYVGNLNADGPFVYCGFRPRWVLIKRTGAGHNWSLYDAARNAYNPANLELFSNTADVDTTAAARKIDMLANGFKIRQADSGINANAEVIVFAAFAEAPFKYSNAR